MPFARQIRFSTPLLAWHELRLLAPVPGWSAEYVADSARLMVPASGWVECQRGAHRFVCDSLSPLWLTPARAYRLRQPFGGQCSVVLVPGGDAGLPDGLRPTLSTRALALLAGWSARLRSGRPEPLAVEEGVLGLLGELQGDATPALAHRAVERARAFIAEDPGREATLADIAAAAACSPYHLARSFRRHTGSSLHGYRTRLRMAAALQRLQQGERNLSVMALELGFAGHSHFSATFRRCFGRSPSAWRRELQSARI